MDVEKSTGLVFGFFVALMLLDFDTLEKRDVLICNVTQLLFDFKHLKGIPSRIVAIQSDVTKICRLVPNDCQQDIEGFKKIINYLRLWLHQNPRYHSKPVKEEQDSLFVLCCLCGFSHASKELFQKKPFFSPHAGLIDKCGGSLSG